MANVPTDRRAVVKVLLRGGAPIENPTTRRIGGYMVIVMGPANPAEWPAFVDGDQEGVVWTTPRQAAQVAQNLQRCEGVVATKEGD